jgi:hypothetical protein
MLLQIANAALRAFLVAVPDQKSDHATMTAAIATVCHGLS